VGVEDQRASRAGRLIPPAYITQWSAGAPWPTRQQVEQDLVLSRLIVEIANHPLLGADLAFRGGTCLHKLHLPTALRYSEDLDYTRMSAGGIGAHLNALREIAASVGLGVGGTSRQGAMVHFHAEAPATDGGEMSIKVEIRIDETTAYLGRRTRDYTISSRWFVGEAEVSTFEIEELMATKSRALYQRSKGRDLFDLWHVLTDLTVDDERIVGVLGKYMGEDVFSYPQLRQNLIGKLKDPDFRADLDALVIRTPSTYDLEAAADLVMERLGAHLKNAPPPSAIEEGAWRGT